MPPGSTRGMFLTWLLPAVNLAACLLFVWLRAPARADYLAELDDARRAGAVVLESGVDGMLACRPLNSWSSFHGGEHLGVKALEVANLLPLVATGVSSFIFDLGLAVADVERRVSTCARSWALAATFLAFASGQWFVVGRLLERHAWRPT